jgi:N-methylhydantoinase A/acetone carboxylase beta subunit
MAGHYIMSMDAGGTMTDTFFVDEAGRFVVGKAQTTPDDESRGFGKSVEDALKQWDVDARKIFPQVSTGIYSGTSMLNRLLERKGRRLGIIVTAGFEDYFQLERGIQTYLGYSYQDRLKVGTHRHNPPLVPRNRIRGVRGRIDLFGTEVIPLYEQEAESMVAELIDKEIEGLVVNLLFSYVSAAHEQAVKAVAEKVMAAKGKRVPIYLSSDLYPVMQDFARLNTVTIEAYAAEPSRGQFQKIADKARGFGGKFELRVMASHGGTISTEAKELARTLISGPIGGMVGAKYVGRELGIGNVVCSDIGGTSFDLGLITDNQFTTKSQPDIARFVLKLPLVDIDSVGAGTGSYVRLDPISNRIEIGPDSAGSRIGMCFEQGGVDTPTLSDCNIVLGNLNPYNFLGGEIILNKDRAFNAIKERIADPLGLDPYDAAEGVLELFENHLRNEVYARVFGKGYAPEDYTLFAYGGGGPMHVAGYTKGLNFADVLVPAWAAGFSAFGCACADFEYRLDRTLNVASASPELAPDAFSAGVGSIAAAVNTGWEGLRQKVADEFAKSRIGPDRIVYRHCLRVQYVGQLNDLEVELPFDTIRGAEDVRMIVDRFEEAYAKLFSRAARSPELGYLMTTAVVYGTCEVMKPALPQESLADETPPTSAYKEGRKIYRGGKWHDAVILEMEKLLPGNVITGPAVVESGATTFVIPPAAQARLDQHRIFHLRHLDA